MNNKTPKDNIEEIKEFDWFKWKFRYKHGVSGWMRNRGFDDGDEIDMEDLEDCLEDYSWELCSEVEKDFIHKDQVRAECEKYLDNYLVWLKKETSKRHLTLVVDGWNKQGFDLEIGADRYKTQKEKQDENR